MKELSDTLQAMKLNEDTQKEPSRGLTATAGTMTIEPRKQPLTESELTVIASKMLLKQPILSSTKRKIYGKKSLTDEYGKKYEVDNEPIGEEDAFELQLLYRPELKVSFFESALRRSPPSATIAHLTHLAVHKRLGSSDSDRALLLHDYAEALRPYSDFVVFLVCRALWESNENPFYPKIKTLVDLCETVHMDLSGRLHNCGALPPPSSYQAPKRFDRSKYYADPRENPLRRELCDFLVSKGLPDHFENFRSYSNYQLEGLARHHGGKAQGEPEISPPVDIPEMSVSPSQK